MACKTMNEEDVGKNAPQHHSILRGLANPRVLALALIYFGTSAGLYTLGIWAPQIIKQLGITSMTVGLLNAIPPIVSVIAMVFGLDTLTAPMNVHGMLLSHV